MADGQLSEEMRKRAIWILQQMANGEQMKNLPDSAGISLGVIKRQLSYLYEEIGADCWGHAVAILMRNGEIQ